MKALIGRLQEGRWVAKVARLTQDLEKQAEQAAWNGFNEVLEFVKGKMDP